MSTSSAMSTSTVSVITCASESQGVKVRMVQGALESRKVRLPGRKASIVASSPQVSFRLDQLA